MVSHGTAIYKKYGDAVVIVTPGNDTKHSINKRNVVKNRQNIWTDKVIPYDIANVFSGKYYREIVCPLTLFTLQKQKRDSFSSPCNTGKIIHASGLDLECLEINISQCLYQGKEDGKSIK